MPRFIQGPSFDKYKRELSVSSRKVKYSLATLLLLGLILTITSMLSIFFIVIPSSYTLVELNLLTWHKIDVVSEFYSLSAVLFIIFTITEIVFLGSFVYHLVQISSHARNYFRIFALEKQEKRFQYTGIFFILYVAFTALGFIPLNYLNTTMFFIGNVMLLLALFMNYRTFQTFHDQQRFIKKPSFLPLVGGIINILSWLIMYFTILSIYGNLIGLFLIYLGFRKMVVDFKLINTESKIQMKDPSTPAPSTPIPKAPSIYNRTMIQDEDSEPATVDDSPSTPSAVPVSSLISEPSIEAPSLTAPKPLDINQKFCPSCRNVVYKTDRVCEHCDVDLTQPES
ncbi:MAG: hypothetical protein H7647_00560 [Candidatus Heimdallarchaeota archaeon]|nr:hypothetical protein [Candidatus Heimdallarchaeota archaeon]MCK4252925.1 hypothetical protein [Candidatus Heimdallarchaeota archaeon]